MKTPEVSVLIPTRNRPTYLRAAVRSALAQCDIDLEIIVIDDASRDDLRPVLESLGDRRIRMLRLDQRVGVARARNIGIEQASGTWLGFLDDDDLWAPDKLRLQLEHAGAVKASFVYGSVVHIDAEGRVIVALPAPDPASVARDILSFNPVPGGASNALAASKLVRKVGGFDERLSVLADWDCWIRLVRSCARVAACDEVVVAYRRHPAAMSGDPEYQKLQELEYLEAKYRRERAATGAQLEMEGILRWIARCERMSGNRARAAQAHLQLARIQMSPHQLLRAGGALLGEPWRQAGSRARKLVGRSLIPAFRSRDRAPEAPAWISQLLGDEGATAETTSTSAPCGTAGGALPSDAARSVPSCTPPS